MASASDGSLVLASPSFRDGSAMPLLHAATSAGGSNLSIPLEWHGAPESTRSFAIEVEDQHPVARHWVHWLVSDIPAAVGAVPTGGSGSSMPQGSREHSGTSGSIGWSGPQPPRGTGPHDYVATLYALDVPTLDIPEAVSLQAFRAAVAPHTLASARLTGTFER